MLLSLAILSSFSFALSVPTAPEAKNPKPLIPYNLNELATKAGKLYFGTATDNPELNNATYVSLLTNNKLFGQLTPGNGMKWEFAEPENGIFNYTDGNVVANLAHKDGQLLRCHNLVWQSEMPDWLQNGVWGPVNLTQVMTAHIFSEVSYYKGKCYCWDVVNEALNEDGTYQENLFYNVLGPDYIKIAFQTASEADPDVKLYYNDYNLEYGGAKAAGAQGIVTMLQDAGIKIDGIGFESHFEVGTVPSAQSLKSIMDGFINVGLEVAITELDVRFQNVSAVVPTGSGGNSLQQQATDYYNIVSACVQTKKCVGITVWDFWDPVSWIPSTFPGQGLADLYNADWTLKPAFYAVAEALRNQTNTYGV